VAASGVWAAPSKATTKGTRNGSKGDKKGLKWRPCCITMAANNDSGDEEAIDSDEECVLTVERDFKLQTRPP
jgi:hypothetical protein